MGSELTSVSSACQTHSRPNPHPTPSSPNVLSQHQGIDQIRRNTENESRTYSKQDEIDHEPIKKKSLMRELCTVKTLCGVTGAIAVSALIITILDLIFRPSQAENHYK